MTGIMNKNYYKSVRTYVRNVCHCTLYGTVLLLRYKKDKERRMSSDNGFYARCLSTEYFVQSIIFSANIVRLLDSFVLFFSSMNCFEILHHGDTGNCTNLPYLNFLIQTYNQFHFIFIMIEFELCKNLASCQFQHFKSYKIQL